MPAGQRQKRRTLVRAREAGVRPPGIPAPSRCPRCWTIRNGIFQVAYRYTDLSDDEAACQLRALISVI